MTILLVILCLILLTVIIVQIGRVSELASKLRGEQDVEDANNRATSRWLLIFMIAFLVISSYTGYMYRNYFLGFGPHESASTHGSKIDSMFIWTLVVTGIVFFITQIALFYFGYKYRHRRGGKASYLPHNNRLEIIWTAIPAVTMAFLVIGGLDVWNEAMSDVSADDDYMEIEATGYQFAWQLRYPGADGKIGEKNYRLITGINPLGQDWTDRKNHDDFHANDLVLPKGKKIRVRITAKDVLHDFYLPQFRVKMDAIPGLPTYFVFTPEKTTEEYRQELRKYEEYNRPDPNQPEKMLWETFEYELACAELCGKGHWSMKKTVRIVNQDEYDSWLNEQQSYYLANIRGTDEDPLKEELLEVEITQRKQEFTEAFQAASVATAAEDRTIVLQYVNFETGSADLTDLSRYELDNLAEVLTKNPALRIEVGGHTDNVGDATSNTQLSQKRAEAVRDYLVGKGVASGRLVPRGYGPSKPRATNDTDEGRAENRRTDFTILTSATPTSSSAPEESTSSEE